VSARALAVHAEPVVNGVVLIDLDRPPPAPVEPPPRVRPRPAFLVAVLALLLVLGGGAAPVPGLTPVLSVAEPVTAFQLAAGSVFLATTSEVRRYDLPGGQARWRREYDRNVQGMRFDESTGTLLMISSPGPLLTAVDGRTGEVLWTSDAPGTAVVSVSRGGVLTHSFGAGESRLQLADVRTGRRIWTHPVSSFGFLGPDELYGDGGSPRIVAVGATGAVQVLNYTDGTVLARGDVGLGGDDQPVPSDSVAVSVQAERIYVSRRVGGRAVLSAYAVHPAATLWRAEGVPFGSINGCGPVLCVASSGGLSGVDPADGSVRWHQPSWATAFRYDATRLIGYDTLEETEAALLDAATGRILHPLGRSQRAGDLILRNEGRQTLVLVGDPASGGLRTTGVMHDAAWFRCTGRGAYLACPSFTGDTGVWRLR
jgi:outer membrane protein assembly factor BamB